MQGIRRPPARTALRSARRARIPEHNAARCRAIPQPMSPARCRRNNQVPSRAAGRSAPRYGSTSGCPLSQIAAQPSVASRAIGSSREERLAWVVCGPSGVSLLTKIETFNRRNWRRCRPPPITPPSVCWGARMSQRCGACSCCRGSGNGYSPVYEAAARHRAFRGNEHATMTHPFSKGRSITRAPPPRPYT